MKIVGLYSVSFTSKLEPTKTEPMETKRMEKRLKGIFNLKTYNFLVMVLVSVNFFRYIAGLLPVDSKLTSRIILLMWFGLVALCSIVMFISCQRSSHLQAFYTRWNNVCERANSVFVNLKFSRFIRIGTVISWLSVLTDITAIAVLFALSGMDFKHQSIRPFSVSATSICVAGVTVTFASGIITFSISFVIYVCHIIKSSFDQLSEYLRRQIKDGGERIPKCLKECRQLHVDLCECVTILDRTFGMLIAILLAVNLLLVCFILYQIVNFTLSLAMMMVCILWLTSSVATILGVTISTALVHEAVRIRLPLQICVCKFLVQMWKL